MASHQKWSGTFQHSSPCNLKDAYISNFRVKYPDVELCLSRVFSNFQTFGILSKDHYEMKFSLCTWICTWTNWACFSREPEGDRGDHGALKALWLHSITQQDTPPWVRYSPGASEERLVELLSIKVRTRWGDHKHLEARNNRVRRRDWCHLGAEEARGISSSQNLKTKGRDRETHVEKAVGKSLAYSGRMWPVQSELIIELDTWVQRTGNLLTQVRFLEK